MRNRRPFLYCFFNARLATAMGIGRLCLLILSLGSVRPVSAWDSALGSSSSHYRLLEDVLDLVPLPPADVVYENTYHNDMLAGSVNEAAHGQVRTNPYNSNYGLKAVGNNSGTTHPEYLWQDALCYYRAGDHATAYFQLGKLIHLIQDQTSVPHSYNDIHGGSYGMDNFEILSADTPMDYTYYISPGDSYQHPGKNILNEDSHYDGANAACAAMPNVVVLGHAANLGKGAALKTGINQALCAYPEYSGVLSADADAQHAPEDILRVAAMHAERPGALVLGSREFGPRVPWRSRLGNRVTRALVRLLIGQNLSDTQTGLRAIPRALLPRLLEISSSGYEFELDMLIAAKHLGCPVVEVPIRTLYGTGNASSHFCAGLVYHSFNPAPPPLGSAPCAAKLVRPIRDAASNPHPVLVKFPTLSVTVASEEHGAVHIPPETRPPAIGEKLEIFPNYVSDVVNLSDLLWVVQGVQVIATWEI